MVFLVAKESKADIQLPQHGSTLPKRLIRFSPLDYHGGKESAGLNYCGSCGQKASRVFSNQRSDLEDGVPACSWAKQRS